MGQLCLNASTAKVHWHIEYIFSESMFSKDLKPFCLYSNPDTSREWLFNDFNGKQVISIFRNRIPLKIACYKFFLIRKSNKYRSLCDIFSIYIF